MTNFILWQILCPMFVLVQIHALISLHLATLKAVQSDSISMLNAVCEFPSDSFEAESLQQALSMAVEKDSILNVAKLAKGDRKLPSIYEYLSRAKEIHAFGVYAVLLMLQAAYADDSQLVQALFGKETAVVPYTSDPDFPFIQAVVCDKDFPINVILEIAQQVGSMVFFTALESASIMTSLDSGCHDADTQEYETGNYAAPGKQKDCGAVDTQMGCSGAVRSLRSQGQPPSPWMQKYLLYRHKCGMDFI